MTLATLKQYAILMRLHRPVGIFLLLWPTLWGVWLASAGHPKFSVLIIFITGVVVMRSAGCIINDIWDRHKDGFVERTRLRPLASKKISVKEAVILFFILMLLAFGLVLQLNFLTIVLAFLGAILAVTYPLLKRVTHLPQVGLGVAFTWGIPMAYAAMMGSVPWEGWVLFLASVCWPIIYDTQYAMADRADDIHIGIKSTAILFGQYDQWVIGILQIIFLCLFAIIGWIFQLNIYYDISLIFAGLFFFYQQFLMKDRDPQKCFQAFLNNQWVGFIIFIGILLGYST
jgi:4-hydroxybenzoate polyprenyltransferase